MARVGLVGGLGPESTIDYSKRIIDVWQHHEPGSAPSIVIDSLDVQRAIRLVSSDRPALIEYLAESVRRLAAAGADFVAMTANTVTGDARDLALEGDRSAGCRARHGSDLHARAHQLQAEAVRGHAPLPAQLALALVLGVYYAYAYHRTGSLLNPVLAHNFADGTLFGSSMVLQWVK